MIDEIRRGILRNELHMLIYIHTFIYIYRSNENYNAIFMLHAGQAEDI